MFKYYFMTFKLNLQKYLFVCYNKEEDNFIDGKFHNVFRKYEISNSKSKGLFFMTDGKTLVKEEEVLHFECKHGKYRLVVTPLYGPSATTLAVFTAADVEYIKTNHKGTVHVTHVNDSAQYNNNVEKSSLDFGSRTLQLQFGDTSKEFHFDNEEWNTVTSFNW